MDNALAVAVTKRVAAECLSRGISQGRSTGRTEGALLALGVAAVVLLVTSSTGNSKPQPKTPETREARMYQAHDYMMTQRAHGVLL